MAKKWAIVIGISQYHILQPLRYAERDAQAIRDFLVREAKFDQVYFLTDRSPKIVLEGVSISTQPTVANLKRFLELRFAAPFLKQGDTLWFFFSGYGLQYASADYLLPSDVDPEAIETTGLTLDALADCLSRSGTAHTVLFLDACRTEEQKFGQGFGTDPSGVVSLFSTALGETTQELEAVQLGAFTHVMLEGLRLKCSKPDSTIVQLFQYVCDRLPQINLSYSKPAQTPRLSAHSAIAPEAIRLPHLPLRASSPPPTVKPVEAPPLKTVVPAIATSQPLKKTLQAGVASALVLAIGFAAIAAYRTLERYFNSPELWMEALTPVPAASPPSPAVFSYKDNFYQRLPRPGTYNAVTSRFAQSYREISSGNGRFCIKVVNAPASASKGQQVIVSTLSFRENGAYIDATQERLQIDGTFTEITDSKSTWQWSKAEVDRSRLVTECLASTTSYVREVKGGNSK
ncbi:MAG: caspase domain-containing protein [Leptolyngbya sp. BL-A-14]